MMTGDNSLRGNDIGYQVSPIPPSMNYDFDDDSDYASGYDSYPSSVLSSDYNYKYENGRRYFARRQVIYPFPNDDEERNRLDLTHHIWTLILDGKMFKAPVGPEPLCILDVATGTGIWAIDVADQHPDSQVIGTDIAPVNPPWAPPNLEFHIEDIEDDWSFPEATFDLIHIRSMAGFVKDWPRLLTQCMTALKPGGYLELRDFTAPFTAEDDSCGENYILQKWVQLWEEGSIRSGKQWLSIPSTFKTLVTAAGFIDIIEDEKLKVPTGGWHPDEKFKEIGMCMLKQYFEGAEGITLDMFTRVLSWDKKEVDAILDEVRRELLNPKVRTYTMAVAVIGRKPLVAG